MMNIVATETCNTLPTAASTNGRDHIINKNHYCSASNNYRTQLKQELRQMQVLEKRAATARHVLVNLQTEEKS